MSEQLDPEHLPGHEPASAPWGMETVHLSPELAKRLPECIPRRREFAIVFGAGGALGPELLHGLLRRVEVVIALDCMLTYRVPNVVYREVNLQRANEVSQFLRSLQSWAEAEDLELGMCVDLATIQTSPSQASSRQGLVDGKKAILNALSLWNCDVRYVYMSTAEVYGAPPGAPYREEHTKAPINVYGRHKLQEETEILKFHNTPTQKGKISIVTLRTWTISMVNYNPEGQVIGIRNYNDPMIALAEKLARAGIRLPVANPSLSAQFHLAEEVAEVCIKLGEAPLSSKTWGRPYNCIGQPTTHGEMRDICFESFHDPTLRRPWWSRPALWISPLVVLLIGLSARLSHNIKWLGRTKFGERLPFLYRSTDICSKALQQDIGKQLYQPKGASSQKAVRVLCEGLRKGGPDALNFKRYHQY